jgi:phosphoribosyl 1,2-cyclic phosphate phosphodiesterase
VRVRLLGTAAAEGWPALFCRCEHCARARAAGGRNLRARSAASVDGAFRFDLGPDTYHQVLAGEDLSAVRHLVFTHAHGDHLQAGELEYRQAPYAHGLEGPLHVWGNARVLGRIRDVFHGEPERAGLVLHALEPFVEVALDDATLLPLAADHDPRESCLIHLFGRGGRWLLYGHDTGYFPEATWEALGRWAAAGRRLDLALLDCTGGPLPYRQGHMGLDACREVRERLLASGVATAGTRFVLTHFSHNGGLTYDELRPRAEPLGFEVAYDGMEIAL